MIKNSDTEDGKTKDLFKRFASIGSVVFGLFSGFLYAFLILIDYPLVARSGLAVMFISAGIMGVAFFRVSARGLRTLPYLAEILKLFFITCIFWGTSYLIRALTYDTHPSETIYAAIAYFVTGLSAGVIWVCALSLVIGLERNVASWEVIRFPVWVKEETIWIWNIVKRMFRR